jgi:predicted dehydrogenase
MIGIGIIGIGGFGKNHLQSVALCEKKNLCRLRAVVIRDREEVRGELEDFLVKYPDVPIYQTLEELIAAEPDIQLISVPTGITSHKALSIRAMEAGYNVICEKPIAGTLSDALEMAEKQKEYGKMLAIGFQNIFSPSIQRIKEIILSGKLGKLQTLNSTAVWKRDSLYYARNDWAGHLYDKGNFIFDSPLQNASAHVLQNLLYLTGPDRNSSAVIQSVYGENYHAQDIESADTQFIRVRTAGGCTINMAATHATPNVTEPQIDLQFEKGTIRWGLDYGSTTVMDLKGSVLETLDNGQEDIKVLVFQDSIKALEEQRPPLCHIHNALSHSACLDGSYRSMNPIRSIPEEYTEDQPSGDHGINTVISGIDDIMEEVFRSGKSFYELGLPWAENGREISIG